MDNLFYDILFLSLEKYLLSFLKYICDFYFLD